MSLEKSPSPERGKSPSSRFAEDLTSYKPGLAVSDPHHHEYLEFDKTSNVERLLKATEPGTHNLSDSFENYVSKSFASAYDRFDSDPNLRRLTTDSKLANQPKFKAKYAKRMSEDEVELSGDSLKSLYDEYNKEKYKRYDFDVYQPKGLQNKDYRNPKSSVSVREIRKFEKEDSPANLETSVSSYKSGFANLCDNPDTKRDSAAYKCGPTRERQVIIDTSRYGQRSGMGSKRDEDATTSFPRSEFLRKNDSMYVGSNFVMLTLRSPDRWYDRVDKLLKEARDT